MKKSKFLRILFIIVGMELALIFPLYGAELAQNWIQLSPAGELPAVRLGHSAVYDEANKRMIVFGGTIFGSSPIVSDVWVLTNATGLGGTPTWVQLAPTGGPPSPRSFHAAAYDPATNRMIIFSGSGGSGTNEVWVLTNANGLGGTPTWVQLAPTGVPPVLGFPPSGVYDPVTNRLIAFGGCCVADSPVNDVWVLTNANGLGGTPTWIQLTPQGTAPTGRDGHSSVYDAATNRMIIFGGTIAGGGGVFNDVWVLTNATGLGGTPRWVQLASTGGLPIARSHHTAVYDAFMNRMIIYAGNGSLNANDVWVLTNANGLGSTPGWIKLAPTGVPTGDPRRFHSAIYDAATNRMTIFAGGEGCCSINLNDVWVLTNANGITKLELPPKANAGPNLSIISEQQSGTIIQGTATDPDNDPLTYRWLEGQNVLLGSTSVETNGEAYLNLSNLPISLTVGTHTITLEVSDGKATTTDDLILTIGNSAPHAVPTGGGTYQTSTPITVGGQVSDFDNDPLTYAWHEGATSYCTGSVQAPANSVPGTPVTLLDCVLPPLSLGTHTVTLTVSDGVNPLVSSNIIVNVIDTTAPTLSPAPDKSILWPPNHKMVNITIIIHASDNSGPPTLSAVVSSNEPQNGLGDGDTAPDWTNPVIDQTTGVIKLQLRAERSGSGDGRKYSIIITATDLSQNASSATVTIIVPHDQGKN